MKKRLLSISLIAAMLPLWGMAQSHVCYTYDNAGNRLSQYTLPDEETRNRQLGGNQDDRSGSTQSRQIAGHTVSVTTNAVTGLVTVEAFGLDSSDDCQLSVYSLPGVQIVSQLVTDTRTTIDLGDCTKGIYILLVRLNDEAATWKILKR